MRLKMVQNHLVLLPGLDGTGELFTPFRHALNNHFTSSVVSYPRDKLLHYQQLIPIIREVIPWDKPYTLVAESFSGPLALQFASVQRENIKAIVLVASFASSPLHPLLEWAKFLIKDSWLKKPLPEKTLIKFLVDEDCPPVLMDVVLETIRNVRPEVIAHRIRMALDTDARLALGSCAKPILYLQGTRDRIVGRRGLDNILAVKPEVTAVEINAPHLLLQRQPREAVAAIEKFLADVDFADRKEAEPVGIEQAAPFDLAR
jgi:pimeloyl-[acyl-carrier protein] methyl ester esterase